MFRGWNARLDLPFDNGPEDPNDDKDDDDGAGKDDPDDTWSEDEPDQCGGRAKDTRGRKQFG